MLRSILGDIQSSTTVGNPGTRDKWLADVAAQTPSNSSVLDVSAGAKPYESLWKHCHYFSHEFQGNEKIVDTFRGESEKDKKMESRHDFVGDISNTGAPSDKYDVVLLTEVLEHVPEPLLAIQELARVSKKGGNIYVTSPFTSGSHQQPYHFSAGYSPEWYQYAAKKYGLQIVEIKSQGDFFKLSAQEMWRAFSCGGYPPGADSKAVDTLVGYLSSYMLKLSSLHGDGSSDVAWCANQFTIGWMVHFRKI